MDNELLMEYECVRRSGVTNMFDYKSVYRVARENGLTNLANACLDTAAYADVLRNYRVVSESEYQNWLKSRP